GCEGNTRSSRSSQIPASEKHEAATTMRLVRRASSSNDGTAKQHARTAAETMREPSRVRATRKANSSGKFPYQMTRYWDQNRYIHKSENPSSSAPILRARFSSSAGASRREGASAAATATAEIPAYRLVTAKYPGNSVLVHCGSNRITRSIARRLMTAANTSSRTTAAG